MEKKEISLSSISENNKCKILYVKGDLHLKRRLLELGFVKNTEIIIKNISPLKNSFLLEIRGYIIALRKNAVKNIIVEVVS